MSPTLVRDKKRSQMIKESGYVFPTNDPKSHVDNPLKIAVGMRKFNRSRRNRLFSEDPQSRLENSKFNQTFIIPERKPKVLAKLLPMQIKNEAVDEKPIKLTVTRPFSPPRNIRKIDTSKFQKLAKILKMTN